MRKLLLPISFAVSCSLLILPAHALLIGVTGPNSIGAGNGGGAGTAPAIIGAPAFALDNNVTNTGMQGFNEAQGVTTSVLHGTDQGPIAIGTFVDSHMIFLNTENTGPGMGPGAAHEEVTWEFSGLVLGVMSQSNGGQEVSSTMELGNPGTTYPGSTFTARGMEGNAGGNGPDDGYTIMGNTLRVSMHVSEPGDWIRVITHTDPNTAVPEPGTILLLGSGLVGLGFWRWKKAA